MDKTISDLINKKHKQKLHTLFIKYNQLYFGVELSEW